MKRLYISALMALAVLVCVNAQTTKLTILHANDAHSQILPMPENNGKKFLAGRGGFLRRVALVKEERAKDPNLLVFESGDFSQGTAYFTMFKGDVEVGLLNMMGIDACTIGNHEFDNGINEMARVFKMAKFDIVCSSYDFTGTPVEGLVKPYKVITRGDIKIGVFGLGPALEGCVAKKNYEGVTYIPAKEAAEKAIKQLREVEKCDMVICVSHIGWGPDNDDPDLEYGDDQLIAETSGIDLVLGGHSHSYLEELQWVKNLDGKLVPYDQNGKHGAFIGKITVELQKQ